MAFMIVFSVIGYLVVGMVVSGICARVSGLSMDWVDTVEVFYLSVAGLLWPVVLVVNLILVVFGLVPLKIAERFK